MATVTLPSTPGFSNLKSAYLRNGKLAMSPYNGTQQAYVWPMNVKLVDFTLPPMTEAQADDWTEFLDDLNTVENTFNVDLSTAFPHETGLSSVEMRLVPDEQAKWDINTAKHFGLSFRAMEVK
jgi:hypothetical protein